MNKLRIIRKGDRESLGKYFLQKSVDFAFTHSFGKSYEYIKEALDILTCDCVTGGWRNKFNDSDKTLFNDLLINYQPHSEYYFVKAYILSFEHSEKLLYLALEAIENYLNINENEYGFYVKGKILLSLKDSYHALIFFQKANELSENSRLLYRIGRIKEDLHLIGENGLYDLYNSFQLNESSACCIRVMKKHLKERNIKLEITSNEPNPLLESFIDNKDEWEFFNLYSDYIYNESVDIEGNFLFDTALVIKNKFLSTIRMNAEIFELKIEEDGEILFDNNQDYHQDEYIHTDDNDYYNDNLDMDQQSQEFWDNL